MTEEVKDEKKETEEVKDKKIDNYPYEPDTLAIIAQALQKERDVENERSKNFDTKSSYLLALCGVGIVAFTKFTDLYKLFYLEIIGTRLMMVSTLIILCLLLAIICFLLVLKPRQYFRLPHKHYREDDAIRKKKEEIADFLIQNYSDCIAENTKMNDIKSSWFEKGQIWLLLAFVLLVFQFLYILPYIPNLNKGGEVTMSEKQNPHPQRPVAPRPEGVNNGADSTQKPK